MYCSYENYEASIGFPTVYDFMECNDFEKQQVEAMAAMAELDQRGHFLQFMV